MISLTCENIPDYLQSHGWIQPDESVLVTELTGGVSNDVFYIDRSASNATSFVLKQVREQLKVPDPWFSSKERIWREVSVMQILNRLLAGENIQATTPAIIFTDRENYAFGMSAAPKDHHVWKEDLLEDEIDQMVAMETGKLLGMIHRKSWQDKQIAEELSDRSIFIELRIEPYYKTVIEKLPHLEQPLNDLIQATEENLFALTHADYSPKNLLVYSDGLMMVDFETGHFGDPSFDYGFFATHLILKSFYAAPDYEEMLELYHLFYRCYLMQMNQAKLDIDLDAYFARCFKHLGGCLLSRLYGKSQIDYLPEENKRKRVQQIAEQLLTEPNLNFERVNALIEYGLIDVSDS